MDLLPLGILSLVFFVLGFSYLALSSGGKNKTPSTKKKVPLEPRFSLFSVNSTLVFTLLVLIFPWPIIYQKSLKKEEVFLVGLIVITIFVLTVFYWLLIRFEDKEG